MDELGEGDAGVVGFRFFVWVYWTFNTFFLEFTFLALETKYAWIFIKSALEEELSLVKCRVVIFVWLLFDGGAGYDFFEGVEGIDIAHIWSLTDQL